MKESFKQMLKDVFKSGDKIRKRYIKVCKDAEKPCYSPNWDVDTRWNSTFEMFESGLKQKMTLVYFHEYLVTKNGRRFKKFPDEYWVLIESLNPLLEVFQNATVILSGGLLPNISTDNLIEKYNRTWSLKMMVFATRSLDWFHQSFNFVNMYYSQYGTNQTQSTSGGGSSSGVSRDPYARLLHGLNQHKKKKSRGDPTMSSEYEQYLKTDFVSGLQPKDFASYDVLGFWKSKENQFLVLSRMAMDILSVQASSVASESAFSTSGRLLTIRRTRLTPESLEMCMCLKDHLDAHERKQNSSPLELP
ncbi:zinc finger BED domain-containing protein RICESLEEPER 2 [Tanacetum coccineum]